jgi:hypothetical protein
MVKGPYCVNNNERNLNSWEAVYCSKYRVTWDKKKPRYEARQPLNPIINYSIYLKFYAKNFSA